MFVSCLEVSPAQHWWFVLSRLNCLTYILVSSARSREESHWFITQQVLFSLAEAIQSVHETLHG